MYVNAQQRRGMGELVTLPFPYECPTVAGAQVPCLSAADTGSVATVSACGGEGNYCFLPLFPFLGKISPGVGAAGCGCKSIFNPPIPQTGWIPIALTAGAVFLALKVFRG